MREHGDGERDMRKGVFWQGMAVAGVVAMIAGCGEKSDGGIEASGTIEATEANVAVKVSGLIAAILPAEGEQVEAGQVIARIDSVDLVWQRKQAAAGLDLARANLELALNGPQPEDIAQAAAAVRQATVQRDAAQTDLRRVETLAASGTAAPGGAILTLAQLDPVRLKVYLTEVEVGRIRLGQAVQVFLDAQPQTPRPGRVTYISPTAEFTPKNVQTRQDRVKLVFAVEIELDNGDGLLKPGLPADARFAEGDGGAGD